MLFNFKLLRAIRRGLEITKKQRRHFCIYEYYDVPWPATDRDIILQTLIHYDSNKNAILIKQAGKPGYLPEKNNMVRVPEYHGLWKLIVQSNGTIYYEFKKVNCEDWQL